MKNIKIIFVLALFFIANQPLAFAEDLSAVSFISDLKQGDSSPAVVALQKLLNKDPDTKVAESGVGSSGFETNYFGILTKNAVIRFQNKYKNDVLTPIGLSIGTGYVGAMTIAKLNNFLKTANTYVPANNQISVNPISQPVITSGNFNSASNVSNAPEIFSVSPSRVKNGDSVAVTGNNFMPVGNSVVLGDGPVLERFDNLPSFDGRTIVFVYKSPGIKTMSENQILSLPPNIVDRIETPIKAVGGKLSDALNFFKDINDETELRSFLEKNGHSFEEMYHYFWVVVINKNGQSSSGAPILHGLRNLPFGTLASGDDQSIFSKLDNAFFSFLKYISPVAEAQMNGGGFTTGILFPCTCGQGVMTFQLDYTGGGTNLYYFAPGTRPSVGSGLVAGPWLGGYISSGGTCVIGVTPYCVTIPGGLPPQDASSNPYGYAF